MPNIDFNKLGKKIGLKKLLVWKYLCEIKKCWMCKKRMNLIIPHPKTLDKPFSNFLNPSFLFHLSDTHGLPPEIIGWQIEDLFKKRHNGYKKNN